MCPNLNFHPLKNHSKYFILNFRLLLWIIKTCWTQFYILTIITVDGPGTKEPRAGPVIVKVADFRGESRDDYRFVDPRIRGIRPRRGPMSGGTRIKILGDYMNAGSQIQAFIGDSPCEIVETRPDKAICITGRSKSLTKAEVRMTFDKGERKLEGKKFEYVEDPKIDYADTGISGVRKVATGIPSGMKNFEFSRAKECNSNIFFV